MRIREIRTKMKLSIPQLVELTGISRRTLQDVELVSEIKALIAGKNTLTWRFTPEDENNYHTVTGTVVINAQSRLLPPKQLLPQPM